MIIGFKHKGLKKFFEDDNRSKIPFEHQAKIADILTALDNALQVEDLDIATFRLHPLTGKRKGTWSVTVRANWRITFTFEAGEADNLNYEDYH